MTSHQLVVNNVFFTIFLRWPAIFYFTLPIFMPLGLPLGFLYGSDSVGRSIKQSEGASR